EAPAATEAPAPTEAPAAATEEPAAAGGEPGGRLRLLWWQAITLLNPHLATGTKDFDGATVILEPLANFNGAGEAVPVLAAEIPTVENGGVSEDLTTTTWTLREGVKWSDGSDFTADDVVFTWQYATDPATAATTASNFAQIENVEAVSPTEVRITWSEPNANYLVAFTGIAGLILQEAQFANCVGAAASTDAACQTANNAPIGTGPYKLQSFAPGDVVIYDRNPEYRDADSVFFDEVEIKGGGDATSAARAVCETGEYDYAWNLQVQAAVLDQIAAGGRCDLLAEASSGIERIVVNFSNPDPALGDLRSEPGQAHPSLTDPAVREAIALAVDREAIATQLYGVTGEPTCNALTTPANLVSPNTTCERDVARANQILDEAGWVRNGAVREKDGVRLVYSFSTSINPLRQGEQAILKANMAEIGIQLDLKAIDAGVFFGGDPGNPDTLNKFYTDLQMYTNSNENPDPTTYFAAWLCDEAAGSANQWNGQNPGDWCNEEYDATFAALQSATDPEERRELIIQLNDILVGDWAIIPLINRFTPEGKSKDLQGPEPSPFDSELWNIEDWSK
ncbi:MAG TPA: peptide ABC transporter substrate-binding protein, partial [Chloroflexaceae bacterium]|nr:peptide ABC transporter substrate-binding protein [Chloroflexaceae bacterium]